MIKEQYKGRSCLFDLQFQSLFGFVDSLVLASLLFLGGAYACGDSKYIMVEGADDRGHSPHSRQEVRNEERTGDQV